MKKALALIFFGLFAYINGQEGMRAAAAVSSGGPGGCPPGRRWNRHTGFCEDRPSGGGQPVCRPGVDNTNCREAIGGRCASDFYCALGRICTNHRCVWWP